MLLYHVFVLPLQLCCFESVRVRRSGSTLKSRAARAEPGLRYFRICGQSLEKKPQRSLALSSVRVRFWTRHSRRVELENDEPAPKFKTRAFIFKKRLQRVHWLIIIIIIIIGPRVQYLYRIQHLKLFLVLLASVVFAGLDQCQPLRLRLL